MNSTSDLATDGNDDDLFEGWFEQSDLTAVPEAAPHKEMRDRRSRVGVVIAAISATALTVVIVLAGRV